MAHNPRSHGKTKQIEIDFHFVKERVADKLLLVRHLFYSFEIKWPKPTSTSKMIQFCHNLKLGRLD